MWCKVVSSFAGAVEFLWCDFFPPNSLLWEGKLWKRLGECVREGESGRKKGISHLASKREVGDTKRLRQKPERRTKEPVRESVRGNGSCGTCGENGTTFAFVLWLRAQ